MSEPAVSVVMPVRNAAPYLEESVGSILAQTFADFELVVLENGATDGSGEVLRALAARDPRIRLSETAAALGRAGSSNGVVQRSRAPVIVRMDADDVSHPRRLERQLEVLRRQPDVVLVGTLYAGIDRNGRRVRPRDRASLMRHSTESPFPHGTTALRRRAFDQVGGYREECEGWEDLDLLHRLSRLGRVLVIPDALYSARFHSGSVHSRMPVQRFLQVATAKDRVVSQRFPGRARSVDDCAADVLYEREASVLWSGERPALLRQLADRRLRSRASLLAWAAWARVSPRSLRAVLRLIIAGRDRVAGLRLPSREWVEWRYG
jgi:glycosyltransferase involved in cell wall biosynthesis